MRYPIRKCGCGEEHECALLDPVANGKRGWEKRKALAQHPFSVEVPSKRVVAEERTREVAPPLGSSRPNQVVAAKSSTQAGASPARPTRKHKHGCPRHFNQPAIDCENCRVWAEG